MYEPSFAIMLVEPHAGLRAILKEVLRGSYRIQAETHPGAALRSLFQGYLPDLLIIDHQHEEAVAHSLLSEIRHNGFFRHIPAILLSSNREVAGQLLSGGGNIQDVLVKPFDPLALLRRVQEVLHRKEFLSNGF